MRRLTKEMRQIPMKYFLIKLKSNIPLRQNLIDRSGWWNWKCLHNISDTSLFFISKSIPLTKKLVKIYKFFQNCMMSMESFWMKGKTKNKLDFKLNTFSVNPSWWRYSTSSTDSNSFWTLNFQYLNILIFFGL